MKNIKNYLTSRWHPKMKTNMRVNCPLLATAKKKTPANAVYLRRCSEEQCIVSITSNPKLLIKGESIADPGAKAADCVCVVSSNQCLHISLIELKSGNYKISDILSKMESTESTVRKMQLGQESIRRYLASAGGHPRVSTAAHVLLTKKANTRLIRCGSSISGVPSPP